MAHRVRIRTATGKNTNGAPSASVGGKGLAVLLRVQPNSCCTITTGFAENEMPICVFSEYQLSTLSTYLRSNYDSERTALNCTHSTANERFVLHASVCGQLTTTVNMTTVYFVVV
jgi:hypothetical protein